MYSSGGPAEEEPVFQQNYKNKTSCIDATPIILRVTPFNAVRSRP